ncbi:MAG: ATP-dependent metallopeptidase FtsH/Yme1/Tma family protein, partial [Lachnospiraceae bacterium]|nr:ATP-dependent metallopeptidase FtsH/Yme1/Tma family protein [Lachnospiraceae bacterium]
MKQRPQFRGMGILLIISIILIILSTMMQKNLFGEHLSYQEFMVAVENKTISEIQIEQNQQTPTGTLYVTLTDGTGATMAVSDVVEIEMILRENEIEYFLIDVPQENYLVT